MLGTMVSSRWFKRFSKLFIIVAVIFPVMSFQSCDAGSLDICNSQTFLTHGQVETVLATLGKFASQSPEQSQSPQFASNLSSVVRAADNTTTCPDSVNAALNDTDKQCAKLGRNEACYGHNSISSSPSTGTRSLTFDKPGDIAKLSAFHTLQLAPLSLDKNTWGIAVLRIQANLPDSAPGQNVTLLAFGDVQVSDMPPAAVSGTSAETATTVPTKTTAKATPTPLQGPLQAFYLSTGVGQPSCVGAPPDGILIQSPGAASQKVRMTINDAQIQLGSTVFVQAQAAHDVVINTPGGSTTVTLNSQMIISTLEGAVTVTFANQTQTAPAGMRIRVPLDNQLRASGPPSKPEPYDYNTLLSVPFFHLPQQIQTIPAPAKPANATIVQYKVTKCSVTLNGQALQSCNVGTIIPITSDPNGNLWVDLGTGQSMFVSKGADGNYTFMQQGQKMMTISSSTPAHLVMGGTINYGSCNIVYTMEMDRIGS